MNFEHLPFGDDRLLALALTAMCVLPSGLLFWFHKKGWVGTWRSAASAPAAASVKKAP